MKNIVMLLLVFTAISVTGHAQKQSNILNEKKLALIIGNNEYKYASVLKNTINDARDMALTLKGIGFETMLYTNLDYIKFLQAIDSFSQKAPDYDVLLFYFSGHGMMFSGDNFLVPVDASLRNNEQQIETECVNIKRVLANFNTGEGKANIAIIDACRNKPFNRNWIANTRDLGTGNRLNLSNLRASGSIVALASGEGETSSDNPKGRNGLFTSSLIKYIKEPGLTVNEVLQLTRKEVKEKSNNSQNPIEFNELVGNFYFLPGKQSQTKPSQKISPSLTDTDHDGIVDSKDKCPYEPGELEDGGCPKNNTISSKKKKNQKIPQSNSFKEENETLPQSKTDSKQKTVRLQEGTTIRLILKDELSSKTAAVGDVVELEVNEDVVVEGWIVIKAGTPVKAEITEASKAKMLGKQGKIDFIANFTTSVDNQNIRIRSSKKFEGKNKTTGVVAAAVIIAPVALIFKGKEAKLPKGTLFNGYVDNTYTIAGLVAY
jgi:Caspase domain